MRKSGMPFYSPCPNPRATMAAPCGTRRWQCKAFARRVWPRSSQRSPPKFGAIWSAHRSCRRRSVKPQRRLCMNNPRFVASTIATSARSLWSYFSSVHVIKDSREPTLLLPRCPQLLKQLHHTEGCEWEEPAIDQGGLAVGR